VGQKKKLNVVNRCNLNTVGKDVMIGGIMWNQELQQLMLMIKL